MLIAYDIDGRPIWYIESSHALMIGDSAVSLDHLARYDAKANVVWLSDELRSWFRGWAATPAMPVAGRPLDGACGSPELTDAPTGNAAPADARFQRLLRRGKDGEREVARVLEGYLGEGAWFVMNDLLLRVGRITAQLDHLVVDAAGLVLVETKVRNNAVIRGRSADRKWTACYPSRKHPSFENPLDQNRHHESLLLQLLEPSPHRVKPDAVDSLIVFLGSDVSHLELRHADQGKVVTLGGLPAWIDKRAEVAKAFPLFDTEQAGTIVRWLESQDASDDADAWKDHERYRRDSFGDSRSSS